MSDYEYKKAVFYPINDILDELCKQYNVSDIWNIEYTPELKNLFIRTRNYNYFSFEGMIDYYNDHKEGHYLTYVLKYSYDESGDFGKSRYLIATEKEKYKKIFEQIIPNIDADKLKYVEYCHYNCCECDDYYIDSSFYKEI